MFRAYGNRILVDCTMSIPGRTAGGLELPENMAVEPVAKGEVVTVGQGVMTQFGWDAPQVRVGDIIQFERRSVKFLDGKKFIGALWAGEILAVERESDLSRVNGKQLVEAN